MPRAILYPIKKEAYLFPAQSLREGDQQRPEEAVRQWCAYELIRSYGFRIDELEFERPVQIGSTRYRIDILVVRRGLPWIVVECKKPDNAKSAEGMAQAISYADSQGVQAPFAVCTNGYVWHVKRRVRGQWLAVPDLPCQSIGPNGEPLTEILRALQAAAPLLHKLDEPLADDEAKLFLGAMQSFFNGGNLLTDGIDRDLRVGTDNILRVLVGADQHSAYQFGKLTAACNAFETYRERAALGVELAPVDGNLSVDGNIHQLHASLMILLEGSQGIGGLDLLLLRLNVALTQYRIQNPSERPYPALPPKLHRALGDFFDAALAINLNAQLPDNLDRILVGDMKDYCRVAWQQLKAE